MPSVRLHHPRLRDRLTDAAANVRNVTEATDAYYYAAEVGELQVLAEEATRASPNSPESRFVAPEGGVIDRLGARFHHVLYGRRGSGKSSLLRHIESDQKRNGHLVAWADQEVFMSLDYPDVLVSTLEAVLTQFSSQVRGGSEARSSGRRLFRRRQPPSQRDVVAGALDRAAASLAELKVAPSESEVEWTSSVSTQASSKRARSREVDASFGPVRGGLGAEKAESAMRSAGADVSQRFKATKAEHLERAIPTYRALMEMATSVSPDAFVILDDFYRLSEDDQPRIAGYFHRVVKDTGVWLKIGSIQYWTRLYSGSMSVGLQVPHDARQLSLDRGLLDFHNSKRFLERILAALAAEVGVDIARLLSDGAKDRLVLAAGGVPRDYVGLLGEAIAVARNRGPSAKSGSDRVIAEDVNEAAGRTVETKFNDLEEDAGAAATVLRSLVIDITNHCRNTGSACFLVDSQDDELVGQINRLENMRFVHAIDTNESLPDHRSSRYHVFLLDVSQLAAQRAWQVDFMGWSKRERRRSRKLVLRRGLSDVATDAQPAAAEKAEPLTLFPDESAIVGDVDPPVGEPAT